MAILKNKMIKAIEQEDLEEKFEKGIEKGKKVGKLEGIHLALEVIRLFKSQKTAKEIARQTKAPVSVVEKIIKEFVAMQ